MKNIKIYQCFYNKDQEKDLDKSFFKLDNTKNLKPELREYYLNNICYEKSIEENLDLWGVFSWSYKSKINISGEEILNIIQQNTEKDVYFFNPYYTTSLMYYNTWENGKYHHKHMISILESLFPLLNIDLKYLYDPMNTDDMFYCCYCIANKKFWDGYNKIFLKYFECLNMLDEKIKKMHDSCAEYLKDQSLNYFPFIHERFLSCYIKMNNFNVNSFHINDKRSWNKRDKEHDNLRKESILEKNKIKLRQWLDKRSNYYGIGNGIADYLYERCSW